LHKITFVEKSVTDFSAVLSAMQGVTAVFHLAAVASVPKTVEDPIRTHDVNVTGTLNVLEAARRAGVSRVVYSSSCAVYGDTPELPKKESMTKVPKSPYALHKSTGEEYAKLYADLFGLETVGLRYFNVFGPRQDPSSPYSGVISIFLERLSNGEPITIFGDGTTTRDFIFVEDVVVANIIALDAHNVSRRVYNIGTGTETTLATVVATLAKRLSVTPNVRYEPERAGDIKRSVADISHAQAELSWKPLVSFEEGIGRLCKDLPR
jgi:UDP-glucose 4-epimerase